jgi:hypothetical protein
MSDFDPKETREELRLLLRTLVQRLTRQSFATPLQKQLDVGKAISLVNRLDDFPEQLIVRRALGDLLRELGKRRPDVHRYVLILEKAVGQLGEELERS